MYPSPKRNVLCNDRQGQKVLRASPLFSHVKRMETPGRMRQRKRLARELMIGLSAQEGEEEQH